MEEEEEEEEEDKETYSAQASKNVSDSDSDPAPKPKPKPRKRKEKKVIPVGNNGLKKKRVMKSRMSVDAKGYMSTLFFFLRRAQFVDLIDIIC